MVVRKVFIVECEQVKNRVRGSFTYGKTYNLLETANQTYYDVIDDNDVLCKHISYVYFISIREWRDYKLDNLI